MKNQKKQTFIGVLLIIVIIIGSFGVTKLLLRKQEQRLLSEVKEFDINVTSNNEINNSSLTIEQIREILITWSDNRDIRVHEPTINQLTMDEAVSKAIEDIKYFCEKGILPKKFADIDDYWNTQAFLGNKATLETSFKDTFSYWTIRFSIDELLIELKQNAYSGDIWGISAYDFIGSEIDNINIEEALNTYADYLNINMSNYSKSELSYGSLTSEDSRILLTYQIDRGSGKVSSKYEIELLAN